MCSPHALQGLGQGGGSVDQKQARATPLPHHTWGSQPGLAAPAEAMKGAELSALPLGLNGQCWGCRVGRRLGVCSPTLPHGCAALGVKLWGLNACVLSPPYRVAEKEPINKMSLHNLATVFGPTLLRPSEGESKGHLTLASDIWSHDVMAQVRAGLAVQGGPGGLPLSVLTGDCCNRACWQHSPFWLNTPSLPTVGPGPSLLPAASSHLLHGAETQHTLLLHGRVALQGGGTGCKHSQLPARAMDRIAAPRDISLDQGCAACSSCTIVY